MLKIRTIAVDDSGRLSVCLSSGFAVQTRLNRYRGPAWGGDSGVLRNTALDANLFSHGLDAAFAKSLWPLVEKVLLGRKVTALYS